APRSGWAWFRHRFLSAGGRGGRPSMERPPRHLREPLRTPGRNLTPDLPIRRVGMGPSPDGMLGALIGPATRRHLPVDLMSIHDVDARQLRRPPDRLVGNAEV